MFNLQPHQEIPHDLIFAGAVLWGGGVAEEGTQLVLADLEISQLQYFDDVLID